ncbi:MAG: hypothetical protein ACPG4N_10580, partial [Gammaproteobacteria bacterium]
MPEPFHACSKAGQRPIAPTIGLVLSLTLAASTGLAADLSTASQHGLAELAPKGRWINKTELRLSGFDHWYNDSGDKQKLGADYDALAIDGTVFPVLALLGPGASLGTTDLDQSVRAKRVEIKLGYGISRNLTAGVILPFGRVCSRVSVSTSGATVGNNPLFNPAAPIAVGNFPFAPVAGPVTALNTAGAIDVLTNPIYGLEYKAPQNRCEDTWGDPTVGFLWRAHESEQDDLILGLGLRLGLAKEDDPDDLFDAPLSDGSTDLVMRAEHFRDWGGGWDTRLNLELNVQTEDHVTRRVPTSSTDLLPTAASKREVARDMGDWMQADIELGHSWDNWRVSGTAHFFRKGSDRYSANGISLPTLEKDTHQIANQWRLSVSWSGADAYRAGHLPLPVAVKLETQQTASGT